MSYKKGGESMQTNQTSILSVFTPSWGWAPQSDYCNQRVVVYVAKKEFGFSFFQVNMWGTPLIMEHTHTHTRDNAYGTDRPKPLKKPK